VVAQFGPRLPFLLKVLAAAEPLSLQAHPDAVQARAGYAAGNVNYVDPYHKPELLVAVDEFEALCGFRSPVASAQRLASLGIPALKPVVDLLTADRLRAAVTGLLAWPGSELVDAVAAADPLAARLAQRYPGDPGVIVALLLNHVVLEPGQAIWMPAGNLHAYLRGTGIEVMAASDNVLRGGLTPKRVDVPELSRVLRFEVLEEPVVPAVPVSPGVLTWPAPVGEFALYRVDGPAELEVSGPRIAICLRGPVTVADREAALTLASGEAGFSPASAGPLRFSGKGEVYVATTASS
jgi:mannose-6-phosphate isomerase